MDDIVAGKSGGTTVLCAGPPGVGKTLTAEVYSEIVQRPLYRVHSGQLGLNVAAMETSLKEALMRAQRWGAVMLIDEADVYIKRREDDMTMNAVVGVFLRVLEYFNGLLFLTTNRIDDIDEAIVSRCIALIRFHSPDDEARRRIWGVMAEQFALSLDAALIDDLVEIFPAATGATSRGWRSWSRNIAIKSRFRLISRCSDVAPSSAGWMSSARRRWSRRSALSARMESSERQEIAQSENAGASSDREGPSTFAALALALNRAWARRFRRIASRSVRRRPC